MEGRIDGDRVQAVADEGVAGNGRRLQLDIDEAVAIGHSLGHQLEVGAIIEAELPCCLVGFGARTVAVRARPTKEGFT